MATEVDFSELVGDHKLSGVDHGSVESEYSGAANMLRFVLDGQIYVATEDPEDGYRSSLKSLERVDGPPVANTFEPVDVIGCLVTEGSYSPADLLRFVLVKTGVPVLTVGTEDPHDYYPKCVLDFDPKALTDALTQVED